MPSLQLYSDSRLPCPQRVLVTAAEKGIDLEIIHTDVFAGENKLPEFIKRQPFGAIPVLVDRSDGVEFVLYESRAISRYLAALSNGAPQLVPNATDLRAVARFEQAASIEVTGFDPFANRLVFEKIFKQQFAISAGDPLLIDSLTTQLAAKLDTINKILGQQDYMAGMEFTVVDIFYMPYMSKLVEMDSSAMFLTRLHLKAWWDRIESRESYQRVFCSKSS
ncbi:hypothetical protein OIDMADRAFT_158221 [Oidiodendron maius Zn]|uniref:glutathione transferase n=1 Tax=Oidiodendron maius (strain Zn) TaxID=913774 RepID=A0A0C3H5T0_OIDMZ|nr:hypothetical protein OIDMADRAFT_158221 [Oidiodendron maius Zn]